MQHVEPDADDGQQRDVGEHEDVVAVDACAASREAAPRSERRRASGAAMQGRERAHTFFTSARPNSPLGRKASATITSAKLRICV